MKRLATRIFIAFFVVLVLTALGAIGITRWFLDERREAGERYIVAQAEAAALALADGGRSGLTSWLRNQSSGSGVYIVDEWGDELLAREVPPPFGAPRPAASSDGGATGSAEVLLRLPQRMPVLVSADDERFRLIVLPARSGMGRPDAWTMPLLLIGLLALLSTALVSLAVSRSITRPVELLERTADRLASGDLEARLPAALTHRRDELGRLGRTFDSMTTRITDLIAARDRLLREVSHELRSPLARMRVALGLMRQTSGTRMELERLETEISHLDRLIGELLDLSRLDADPAALARERVDLAMLTDRVAGDATFEAASLGCRVVWQAPEEPCWIEGDQHWVSAALENVVRNAIHHAPRGSAVEIHLARAADDWARVTVKDSGSGVPDAQLSRIFEPFHRLGSSRAGSDRLRVGIGLGLAIAARVVAAHAGHIVARRRSAAGGLEVEMSWPLVSGPSGRAELQPHA